MVRQIKIFLVRHALSAANLDKTVNSRLPDNQVPLAPEGYGQAKDAGEFLSDYVGVNGMKTRILCSPYRRTRETSFEIEEAFTRHKIAFDKREEVGLREISFGLFDGISDEELPLVYPREHTHYKKYVDFEGEFYAPMPMGESRVQVADRVKGTFGTIIRDNANGIDNFIVVSHGVTIRAFMMQWLHYSPEWYQSQLNPNNASINLISSDGVEPYRVDTIYKGFPHIRQSKQDHREEGKP